LATTSQEVWEEEVVERADEEEKEKFMNRYWQADEEGTYEGKKKTAGIKLQYFCQYGDKNKKNKTKTQQFLDCYLLVAILYQVLHIWKTILFCSKEPTI
jgi:hypothetical protein